MKISYKIYRIKSKMLGFNLDDRILEEIREEHSERFEKMRLTILKTYTQW